MPGPIPVGAEDGPPYGPLRAEAHRLDGQHQAIEESLRRLTALAEAAA